MTANERDTMSGSAITNPGLVRSVNEDAILLADWPDGDGTLIVVADGMGSYRGGDIAAGFVIRIFEEMLLTPLPDRSIDRYELLLGAFYRADAQIRSESRGSLADMGATVVACIITAGEIVHLHAGDCRLYHARAGAIIYRTSDHSAVQVLIDSGKITSAEARVHSMRNLVTSCLGGPGANSRLTIDPPLPDGSDDRTVYDDGPFRRFLDGDSLLLCSDGLWGEIDPDLFDEVVKRNYTDGVGSEALTADLLALALAAGGSDNISIIATDAAAGDRRRGLPTGKLTPASA